MNVINVILYSTVNLEGRLKQLTGTKNVGFNPNVIPPLGNARHCKACLTKQKNYYTICDYTVYNLNL